METWFLFLSFFHRSSGKMKRCRSRRSSKECAPSSERRVHAGMAEGRRILAGLASHPRPPDNRRPVSAITRPVDQDADPEATGSKRKEGNPGSYPAGPVRKGAPNQPERRFPRTTSPALCNLLPPLALTSCTGYILDSVLTEPNVSPPSPHQATFTGTVVFFHCITARAKNKRMQLIGTDRDTQHKWKNLLITTRGNVHLCFIRGHVWGSSYT